MTQSPLGHDPSQPGPFDGPGPGEPDLPTTQQDLTTTQGASVPDDPAVTGTSSSYADESFSSEPTFAGGSFDDRSTGLGGTTAGGIGGPGSSSSDSKTDTAKSEAKQVAGTAVDSGKQVAQTAKEEVANVAAETKQQAASLFDTVRTEASQQVSTSQGMIAEALHGLAKELGGMASASEESGPLTDLAHEASRRGGEVAHWLQDREPADVLDSVRTYGRQHPVAFLALCGLAGVVAGRLTRSAVATRTSLDSKDDSRTGHSDQLRSSYVTTPVTRPVADPVSAPVSTGVYGGSLETTAPADPYDRPPAGPGYVGPAGSLDDPNGDLTR